MTRGRRPSRNEPSRRAEIQKAAAEVFTEFGYSRATTAEIARRANASKTTIYALFGSKAGLLEELFQGMLRRIPVGLDSKAALETPDQYDFLKLSVKRILASALDPLSVALYRVALAELTQFPELTAILCRSRNHEGLTAYLAQCRELGWMEFDDAEEAATMFINMAASERVYQMLIGARTSFTEEEIDRHAALTARMFLAAVAPGRDG